MTSREAMIYQLKNLKGKTPKEKIIHIFTYFWAQIAVILFVLVFAVSMIITIANRKDTALTFYCINSLGDREQFQEYLDTFGREQNINMDEYQFLFFSNIKASEEATQIPYETAEAIAMYTSAQQLDLIAGNTEAIIEYAYKDMFIDLSQLLTKEQMEKYASSLLYIDLAHLEELEEDDWEEEIPQHPDPMQPQTMIEPIPVAVLLPEDSGIKQIHYPNTNAAMGFVGNAPNVGNALAFLAYILE